MAGSEIDAPAMGAIDIDSQADDDADLTSPKESRSLILDVAGNIKVTMVNGDVVTFSNLSAGVVYPFRIIRLWSTNTTATGIKALY